MKCFMGPFRRVLTLLSTLNSHKCIYVHLNESLEENIDASSLKSCSREIEFCYALHRCACEWMFDTYLELGTRMRGKEKERKLSKKPPCLFVFLSLLLRTPLLVLLNFTLVHLLLSALKHIIKRYKSSKEKKQVSLFLSA